jgi:predicted nucleotidyltransferase component of viral defense system
MSDLNLHNDRDLFREAVSYSAAVTKFLPRLVEKDYFCTLLLEYFLPLKDLVFKGGTCLAKVHANFYRLSEDLDFTIPIAIESDRKARRKGIEPVKTLCDGLVKNLPFFTFAERLKGANESTQYIAVLNYGSLLSSNTESIKVEISLREPLMEKVELFDANTILLDPINGKQIFSPVRIACISKREAYAEKFRAALTRRDPAIRDYFDIDYAITRMNFDPEEKELITLVQKKLAVPGNDLQDINEDWVEALRRQLEAELKPVLRQDDYEKFDLDRALRLVNEMKHRVVI